MNNMETFVQCGFQGFGYIHGNHKNLILMKKLTDIKNKVLEFVKEHPDATPEIIIDGINMPKITVYSTLKSLVTLKAISMKEADGKKTYNVVDDAKSERAVVETT